MCQHIRLHLRKMGKSQLNELTMMSPTNVITIVCPTDKCSAGHLSAEQAQPPPQSTKVCDLVSPDYANLPAAQVVPPPHHQASPDVHNAIEVGLDAPLHGHQPVPHAPEHGGPDDDDESKPDYALFNAIVKYMRMSTSTATTTHTMHISLLHKNKNTMASSTNTKTKHNTDTSLFTRTKIQ